MNPLVQKENYAKSISLFLAELLRTRKVQLSRAAEIAQQVLANINLIETEEQFLKFIKLLSSEFEELTRFQDKISFDIQQHSREYLEDSVRQFVILYLSQDVRLACSVLEEAVQPGCTVEQLCGRYPQFKEFKEKQNG